MCKPITASAKWENVGFATGFNGPIDNGDDWRYFDWSRITTVITLGPTPQLLVCTAHKHGVRVVKGSVFDVDSSNKTARREWVAKELQDVVSRGADGINLVRYSPSNLVSLSSADLTALVKEMREALLVNVSAHAHLSVTVNTPLTPSAVNYTALVEEGGAGFIVAKIFGSSVGSPLAKPNAPMALLDTTLQQFGVQSTHPVPPSKLVFALPWFGKKKTNSVHT
jgi:hypothetical protein